MFIKITQRQKKEHNIFERSDSRFVSTYFLNDNKITKIGIAMHTFFVPFCGEDIVTVNIKGHPIVIISTEKDIFEDCLNLLGADRLVAYEENSTEERNDIFFYIAMKARGDIVLAPHYCSLNSFLISLDNQYEWIN